MRGAHLIREARRRAGLTQAELAARVGTTQSAIARLENGVGDPSLARLTALIEACGLELQVRLVPIDTAERSLLETTLASTPVERLRRNVRAARFVERGRRAMSDAANETAP